MAEGRRGGEEACLVRITQSLPDAIRERMRGREGRREGGRGEGAITFRVAVRCSCFGNFARTLIPPWIPSPLISLFYRFLFPRSLQSLSVSVSLLPLRRRISLMDLSHFPFRGLISPLQQHQDKHSERPREGGGTTVAKNGRT